MFAVITCVGRKQAGLSVPSRLLKTSRITVIKIGSAMKKATQRYLALLRFTAQGRTNIKDSTKRAQHFRKQAKRAGVTVDGQFWTTGAYDGALILASEDGNKVLQLLLALSAEGNVRVESMQAFTSEEFSQLAG